MYQVCLSNSGCTPEKGGGTRGNIGSTQYIRYVLMINYIYIQIALVERFSH